MVQEDLLSNLARPFDRRDPLAGDVAAEAPLLGRDVLIDEDLAGLTASGIGRPDQVLFGGAQRVLGGLAEDSRLHHATVASVNLLLAEAFAARLEAFTTFLLQRGDPVGGREVAAHIRVLVAVLEALLVHRVAFVWSLLVQVLLRRALHR